MQLGARRVHHRRAHAAAAAAAAPQDADSTGTKLSGSVINALIFVGIIAALTFVMVLLFKYGVRSRPASALAADARRRPAAPPPAARSPARLPPSLLQYTRIIYIYMAFSGFTTFFVLCGIIAIEVLQKAGAHMDWISFAVILFNFAVRRDSRGRELTWVPL
jgi:presenilin 1